MRESIRVYFTASFFLFIFFIGLGKIQAQKPEDIVEITVTITTNFEICRYCQDKGYTKKISDVRFKNPNYNTQYGNTLDAIKLKLTMASITDFKNLSKICDISRTGKHGIDFSNEQEVTILKKSIEELNRTEKALIAKKKERLLTEKSNNDVRLQIEKINQLMLLALDSFNNGFNEIKTYKDSSQINSMYLNLQSLVSYAFQRDGQENVKYNTTVVIETASDASGFGGVYKDFSYAQLEARLLFAMLIVGAYDNVIRVVDNLEKNNIKSKELFTLKGMGYLMDGQFIDAATTFTAAYDKNVSRYSVLCEEIKKYITEFKMHQPGNKNLKLFGITKLQLSLAVLQCQCQF